MTILYINTGTSANAGNGDSLRTAFTKINENFTYLESAIGTGGGGSGGGTGTITLANLGDIVITRNVISTTNTNQDIILNPNGTGRVRLANSTLQFDNGFTGRTNAHLLNTKVGGSAVGLGLDDANASLRIVGDKENLGTLADFGLYTGPLNSWARKVYIDYQGNLTANGNIRARGNIESETYIHAAGNIQADGDVQGSYIIAGYGFKFADGTTQITAVSTTTATPTRLGSIKVGSNLSVTGDGTLSAIITGTVATTSSLGVVQVGAGLQITPQGILYVQGASGGADVITTSTIATTSSLGIVQIGNGLAITPEGILSTTGLGLGHLLVNDTTVYPDSLSKPVTLANIDITGGTTGASYITIPATDDTLNDMRILSHGVMLITTEPDITNGIVVAPGVDGFGPGYVAVGASGTSSTSGLFLFSANAQINMWPNENISYLNSDGDPNVGTFDMFTYNAGHISLRPDSTATVIITGGGIDIRSGGLKFPDGTYMTTGASTGVVSFNGSAGAITFTGSNIISQLGYTPYNGATNPNGYLTNAVLSFNGATGVVTFTASNIISQLGFTPYNSLNPAGYISGSSVVRTFNGSTGTITFTATDIISQLGYTPYNGATNSNKYLTTASLASVSGNILPSLDKQFDLGSPTRQWRSMYVSSSTLYIGGVAVSVNGAGNLLVNGANVSTSGYDQSLNTTDNVQFNKVTTTAVTFSDGSTQTTAVFQVPLATTTQTGIVYALTSATSTAPVALGYNALRNDAGSGTNTAVGYNAMCANTLGNSNTAVGARALAKNTTGNYNVAVGVGALCFNTTGEVNVAVGVGALTANTYGSWNSALGYNALFWNKTGYGNVAVGAQALYCNCGDYNVAIGCVSLQKNSLGYGNVGVGSASLNNNTYGSENVAVGNNALLYNTTGNSNVAVGPTALMNNTYGQYNVAMGYQAMCFNTTGNSNVAIGTSALWCNSNSDYNVAIGNCAMQKFVDNGSTNNVAIGSLAMQFATGGGDNIAIGSAALYCSNTFSIENIAIGSSALFNNISGSGNVAIGYNTLCSNTVGIRNVAIGYGALSLNTSGRSNVAIGLCALLRNTSGCGNVAIGCSALQCNTTGYNNIAIGVKSLGSNVQGRWNVALGDCALCANTSGYQNVAIGLVTMAKNTTGYNNTALGFNALCANTVGDSNVALGWANMVSNTSGSCNTALGVSNLTANTFGANNVAVGRCALTGNTAGCHNIGIGCGSLAASTTGNNNIAIGQNSGCLITAGSNNVIIGSNTGTIFSGGDNNVLLSDGSGNVKVLFTATGAMSFGNTANFGTTGYVLQSNGPGSAPSWVTAGTLTSGIATTATNLQNGTAGQIPYQTGVSATSFFGPGTAGQLLVSAGTSAPIYTNTSSIQVGAATNILGGGAGQLTYQSASGATTFLALGTQGQVLTAGASAPQYTTTSSLFVGYSNNVTGGAAGQLHYQSNTSTTTFLALGTQGQVLVAGASSPTYTNTSTLQVGFATNVLGGTAGAVGYQSGSGATSFITGTVGNIMVSGGTAAPVFQNTLTLAGTTLSSSSSTGALVVAGGAGIGKSLYVGDTVDSQKVAVNSNASSTTTNIANALYVAGGAWIGGSAVVKGNAIFDGTVVFNSSTIYTVNQSVSTSSNFLQLHSPSGATWTFNDGKDIGLIFNYYASGDANAFLGRAADTGYLEWYETGTDGSSVFTGTYGTFKTGNVQLVSGTSNLGNTNTGALTVTGGVGISGGLYVGGTITGSLTGTASQATNLNSGAAGSVPYQSAASTTAFLGIGSVGQVLTVSTTSLPAWTSANLITVGQSTTSTNLVGGTSGQIPYQLSAGSTAFFGPGTAGQLLVSAGTNTPVYTNTGSIFVGFANNLTGGATGSIAYQSSTSTTAFLALGTSGKVLTAGASGPQWTDIGTVTAGASTTATNIAGGTAGQLHYQSAPGTTAFAGPGTAGQLLVSNGTSAPTYTNTSTIQVGFATNVLGGSAGQIHYQSGSGATGFVSGTAGQVLVSNGTSAPSFNNTTSLFVGYSNNVVGGAKGGIPYQTDTSTTALLAIGTQGQVLTVNNTGDAPQWISVGALSAGIATTATNLQNGTAGQIPYQSAAGVTSFVGGTSGQLFVSGGSGTPSFINTTSIFVGNANTAIHVVGTQTGALLYQTATNQTGRLALGSTGWFLTAGASAPQWTDPSTFSIGLASTSTNIAGGTSGQIPYQTGANATSFFGPGTSGQVLVSNGTSAPSYSSVVTNLSLTTPTVTGGITYSQTVATTVNTAAVTIDSFTTSTYRSVKYVVSIANTLTNEYQATEALVVHNGTSAFIKSDSVFSGQFSLMSLSVTVTAGSVQLQGTGVSNGNQVKVQRIYI